ncbi:MAG: hydrogenase formation protein HypD [Euryarchaeota archaeon]|nr:hydrogenase formation protein HypD [Euryarchaeota archaeon]
MFRYRNKEVAQKIVKRLKEMNLNIRIMHVCGTHQDTLVRYGLDTLFRECGVEMRQGPGCPICVTTPKEYEEAITLAREGKVVATFGDAIRVPGITKSLADMRTEGNDIRVVYSIEDAVNSAKETQNDVIFLAIGFETTAPSTAATLLSDLPNNFSILTCHRYVPPALKALMEMGELKLHGLIDPGHVSTVIGMKPYEEISKKYHVPQVIAGFEPLDMLMGVYMLARQIKNGEAKVENEYTRSVRYEGNAKAIQVMNEVFEPFDLVWRGFSIIPNSGMKLKRRFEEYNAKKIYEDELKSVEEIKFEKPKGCRCDEILRGLVESKDCPLFGRACTPQHPVGPCMVSVEGSCNIEYKYGTKKIQT